MNGRGLRISEGKNDCWFLDFCGNIKRLGMPTDSFPLNLCPTYKPQSPIPTKTCPNCGSEVAAYEKICPVCGYIFPPGKDKAEPLRRQFEEVLSPEQKKHVQFLKIRTINAYNKRKKLDNLNTQFSNKFGYEPPSDWYDGLIWGYNFKTWEVNVQHYWRYLLTVTPNPGSKVARDNIEKLIHQEFKSAIKRAEEDNKDIHSSIEYKPWWVILKSNSIPDALSIDGLYVQRRGEYQREFGDKPELLIPHMELLATAVGEGIEYYAQNEQTINEHIHRIKQSIAVGAFLFVREYSARLDMTIKQRVWSSLTSLEKQAYRRWQNENPMQTLPQHQIKTNLTESSITPQKHTTNTNNQYISNRNNTTNTTNTTIGHLNSRRANTNTQHSQPVATVSPATRAGFLPGGLANPEGGGFRCSKLVSPPLKKGFPPQGSGEPFRADPEGNTSTTTTERTNTNNTNNTNISNKDKHIQPYKAAAQLSLFTLPEDDKTKAANDICNPLRLTVGELVASNNPNNEAYNWCGQIMKNHPSDPRLCYVSYPERKKIFNKNTEVWRRFVDLRRV